jgi:hypothetical protein
LSEAAKATMRYIHLKSANIFSTYTYMGTLTEGGITSTDASAAPTLCTWRNFALLNFTRGTAWQKWCHYTHTMLQMTNWNQDENQDAWKRYHDSEAKYKSASFCTTVTMLVWKSKVLTLSCSISWQHQCRKIYILGTITKHILIKYIYVEYYSTELLTLYSTFLPSLQHFRHSQLFGRSSFTTPSIPGHCKRNNINFKLHNPAECDSPKLTNKYPLHLSHLNSTQSYQYFTKTIKLTYNQTFPGVKLTTQSNITNLIHFHYHNHFIVS